MELSEAIKAGAKLRPQAFGTLFGDAGNDQVGSCALGAAQEGAGFVQIANKYRVTWSAGVQPPNDQWPIFGEATEYPCACGLDALNTVGEIIPHLNDVHRWSREQIAAWVKHIENK